MEGAGAAVGCWRVLAGDLRDLLREVSISRLIPRQPRRVRWRPQRDSIPHDQAHFPGVFCVSSGSTCIGRAWPSRRGPRRQPRTGRCSARGAPAAGRRTPGTGPRPGRSASRSGRRPRGGRSRHPSDRSHRHSGDGAGAPAAVAAGVRVGRARGSRRRASRTPLGCAAEGAYCRVSYWPHAEDPRAIPAGPQPSARGQWGRGGTSSGAPHFTHTVRPGTSGM